MNLQQVSVDAPFNMPNITVPDFEGMPNFIITDFGAELGNKELNTLAFAKAIAEAGKEGGRVLVPKGEWLCGKIHLKSRVNLHLEEGATILFSEDPKDYLPPVETSWEGIECFNYSPLIYAYDCEQVAISGKGKLIAKLDVWRVWYERPQEHLDALVKLYYMALENTALESRQMVYEGANLRPHFIQFNRCRQVLIEDVEIENSPFWVVHPYLCEDVIMRRVTVKARGHNNDGVDPEMTQNMLIEDCIFDQGDDAIALKSGRDHDAWRLSTATRNIVVRNCEIKNALQLLAVGSELSGGIENVLVEHCDFDDGTEIQEKSFGNLVIVKTNERRGGFVKNIFVRNIQAKSLAGGVICVDTDVLYQWRTLVPTFDRRLTQIEGLYLDNISVDNADFICRIEGQEELPVESVVLKGVQVNSLINDPIVNNYVNGFKFEASDDVSE